MLSLVVNSFHVACMLRMVSIVEDPLVVEASHDQKRPIRPYEK